MNGDWQGRGFGAATKRAVKRDGRGDERARGCPARRLARVAGLGALVIAGCGGAEVGAGGSTSGGSVATGPGAAGAKPGASIADVGATCSPGSPGGPTLDASDAPASVLALGLPASAAVAPPAVSGGTLLVLSDKTTVAAADPDRDAVYLVDLASRAVTATIAIEPGDEPGRGREDGAGRVHVALRRGGAVVTIDPVASATVRPALGVRGAARDRVRTGDRPRPRRLRGRRARQPPGRGRRPGRGRSPSHPICATCWWSATSCA